MAIERSVVTRIAALAKLELEEHEVERMTRELNDILEHCRALQRVDLSEVNHDARSATSAPERRPGTLVRDELAFSLSDFAPSHVEGFLLVPRLPAPAAGSRDGGAGEGEAP
ncbi:MAG: Asp-tRNA(Asn)/Glu-tRNA(Gln) amidotransferase subunit GatC [Longimicrobiales bacterium]